MDRYLLLRTYKQVIATVYVPAGKEAYFLKKITEYATKETKS